MPEPLKLIGHSRAIQRLREDIAAAARTDAKVLITGESGNVIHQDTIFSKYVRVTGLTLIGRAEGDPRAGTRFPNPNPWPNFAPPGARSAAVSSPRPAPSRAAATPAPAAANRVPRISPVTG